MVCDVDERLFFFFFLFFFLLSFLVSHLTLSLATGSPVARAKQRRRWVAPGNCGKPQGPAEMQSRMLHLVACDR